MEKVAIYTEYITLGQFLKLKGIIAGGSDAKNFLMIKEVLVNGVKEERRGRKLYRGDVIKVLKTEYMITKE
ncbi:MAG: S4 domain-containing protein YaaA [Bacilli bacterium]|jgi:ribosome-associated protein